MADATPRGRHANVLMDILGLIVPYVCARLVMRGQTMHQVLMLHMALKSAPTWASVTGLLVYVLAVLVSRAQLVNADNVLCFVVM